MTVKVAVINNETNIVENLIMVDSVDHPPFEGYTFVEVPIIEIPVAKDVLALEQVIKELDPSFEGVKPVRFEKTIHLNKTKWTPDKEFFEED